MSDDNNGRFNLSRRKALAGLGGIGATAALGGLGTTALYSDVETAEFTMTAGTLNLQIDAKVFTSNVYDDGGGSEDTSAIIDVPADDFDGALVINLNDVKPGDCFCVIFSVHVESNPGWVWHNCLIEGSDEGLVTDPEKDSVDPSTTPGDDGELEDVMMAEGFTLGIQNDPTDCPDSLDALGSGALLGEVISSSSPNIHYFDGDNDSSTPIKPLGAGQTGWFGWQFCLPVESRNQTQGDKLTLSCDFHTEQARNNPIPSPEEDGLTAQGDSAFDNPYVDNSPS